jgi:hypothetical protein
MPFEEPTLIAKFDRSFGDKKEELRFERGEYKNKPTFALRMYWQTPDGAWRWCTQTPGDNGKCWKAFHLKAHELQALGEAFIHAAADVANPAPPKPDFRVNRNAPVAARPLADDDIPF